MTGEIFLLETRKGGNTENPFALSCIYYKCYSLKYKLINFNICLNSKLS